MATNTATSFTNHTAPSSGATAGPYAISFDYLEQSDVDVTVNGTLQALGVAYTFTSGTQITFTSGNEPANGAAIVIRRDTNISAKKVDFQDGSVLTETDLDTNTEQILFGLQEFTDKINGIEDGATGDMTPAEILAAIVQVDGTGSGLDADKLDGQEGSYYLDGANLNLGNIQIGVTGNNEIDTSSGNLTIDSAGGTTTVDDNLNVTGDLTVTGSITAPTWNGNHIDTFWLTNKQTINHIGETITLGKSSTGTGNSFQVSNATHRFSVAKDYTFEVGRYVNEGQTLGNFGGLSFQPCFQVQHLLDQTRVTKIGSSYSVTNIDEAGYINLGTGTSSWINSNTNLNNTSIRHSHLVLSGIRGNSSSNAITNPNNLCPTVVLSPERGAMFTHPDNTTHSYTQGGSINSGLNELARGAYTQGTYNLGDPAGYGNNGYVDASEALVLLEAAVDFQIIVGGARAKNKFEIGSSSVAGTLQISGTDVTSTAAEINKLTGITASTSELNILDGVTADKDEINLLDGKSIVTSIAGNATDTELPSALAVNNRIIQLVTEVGGFHPIANETSFPTTNPDINDAAGTIVSIADAGGLKVADGSGSGTYAGTAGNSIGATTTAGTAVTITGIDTTLRGTTIGAGKGILVETTANLNEYVYHRLVLDESGVANADTLVTNFNERYYGPLSSNPATRPSGANRQDGDLYFNSSDNKMKVYNGTHASGSWDDVAAPANFFINTLSSSSGSGGGQSAFNSNATRFTLSNPPLTAQQLLVSVNGVIQKPNSGTSPSEGFAIDGADIIFASAPATSAPFFIITIGSSVSIGTPSDGTVTTIKLDDGAVNNAKVSSTAGILGSKLANLVSNDANNRILTATGTTNSFNGESNLTYDGSKLQVATDAHTEGIRIVSTGDTYNDLVLGANRTSSATHIGRIVGEWNGGQVASIAFNTGADASGKDDGFINFQTSNGGSSMTPKMTIQQDGKIGIGTESPQANLDLVDTNASLLVRPSDGNAGEARLYLGGGGANQLKSAIIFDPAGGFCRGDLKFCVENTADTSNVDSTDAKLIIQANGDVAIGSNDVENIPLHVKGASGQTTILKLKSTETTVNQQWMTSANANCLHQYDGLSFNTYTPSSSGSLELQHQINLHGITLTQGKGINFHNYGQGTNINGNQLNDYEEGTWSAAIHTGIDNGSGGAPTFSINQCRYTKVGNQVFVSLYLQMNQAYGTGIRLDVSGLPFNVTVASGNGSGYGGSNYVDLTLSVGNVPFNFFGGLNTDRFESYYGPSQVQVTNNSNQNNKFLIGGFTYFTES